MSTKKTASNHTEIRIGISDSTQELHIESDQSQEQILADVSKSLTEGTPLILSDVKGRQIVVPQAKISFVEVGSSAERKVGFATI